MAASRLIPHPAAFRAARGGPRAAGGASESTLAARRIAIPVVSARDRRTLEIRQFLPLPRRQDQEEAYSLDAYFYFPQGFGINSETWTREAIYRDAETFLRLHAPGLQLSE